MRVLDSLPRPIPIRAVTCLVVGAALWPVESLEGQARGRRGRQMHPVVAAEVVSGSLTRNANGLSLGIAVEVPAGINPKLYGAVPGPLARAGIIAADGFTKTSRPTAHARPITGWQLANRQKAERWLEVNSDLPGESGSTAATAEPEK